MNVTLEYSDDLIAIFTCTAFGGLDTEIVFTWSAEDLQDYSLSTVEILNADNSTTSTATFHSTQNRESLFSCCVSYDYYSYYHYYYYYYHYSSEINCETATANIGKK